MTFGFNRVGMFKFKQTNATQTATTAKTYDEQGYSNNQAAARAKAQAAASAVSAEAVKAAAAQRQREREAAARAASGGSIGMGAQRPNGYTPTEIATGSGNTTGGTSTTPEKEDKDDGGNGGSTWYSGGGGSTVNTDPVTGDAENSYDKQIAAGAAQTQKLAETVDMTPEIDAANQAWADANKNYADTAGDIIDKTGAEQQAAIDEYADNTTATIDALKGVTDTELAAYAQNSGITIEQARQQINDVLAGLENMPNANVGRVDRVSTAEQENLLAQLTESQKTQAAQAVDYTVQQGINELNRAVEDAAAEYQTERNQIAAEEQRALANQALYSEMRGDRGGVGQEQYNSIANTAATNQLTVNAAQTKLSTDTARQIADLRAQGEFEKADKLLEISQQYLSELMDLKQWAMETNLSVDEFNIGVDEWEQEYNRQVQQLVAEMKTSAAQWQANTELSNQQYITGQNLSAAQSDASLRLSQDESLRSAKQNLSSQLASLGLANAEAVTNNLVNQITSILSARTSNASNMANTEMNAANITGAFSNGTATADMWSANQATLASAAKALLAAGVQLTPDQVAATGMTLDEYNAKTPAQWKEIYS